MHSARKASVPNLSAAELEEVTTSLSDLIYLTGKQRTLSHRVVLHASLLPSCTEDKAQNLFAKMKEDRKEFDRVAAALQTGDADMRIPALSIKLLWSSGKADRRAIDLMREFQRRSNVLFPSDSALPPAHIEPAWMLEIAEFVSGPLMDGLSDLTFGVRNTLNQFLAIEQERSEANRNLIHSATGELKRMSNSVQMLAINAKVESRRLGDAGAAMQYVADEMTKLSKNVREFSQKIARYVDDHSNG